MTVTPGIWVKAILESGSKAYGKYATLGTETLSFAEYLQIWSEVTGKKATYLECSKDFFASVWGEPGRELALQYSWGEDVTDWDAYAPEPQISMDQLGISADGIGTRAAFETLKTLGLLAVAA